MTGSAGEVPSFQEPTSLAPKENPLQEDPSALRFSYVGHDRDIYPFRMYRRFQNRGFPFLRVLRLVALICRRLLRC